MQPTDLRGILAYTTHFQGETFVLSLDSEVIAHENFRNLLLDISVLRSLDVYVVLVHGASWGLAELAERLGTTLSDQTGRGITDPETFDLCVLTAARLTQKVFSGLAEVHLRGAVTNAIVAHPSGIVDGVDQQRSGRVERVDILNLKTLLQSGMIPVIPPFGWDGEGQMFRVHADHTAVEVARAIGAAKVLFVGTHPGVREAGTLSAQFSVTEAEQFLKNHPVTEKDDVLEKMRLALKACRAGINRVHLIDGLRDEALLSELFSNEGVGTMVYANEYEAIRPARKKDVQAIRRLIAQSLEEQEVVDRSEAELINHIADFFVFEIDRNVVGCVALHLDDPEAQDGELACLIVSEAHSNQGIGRKLITYAESVARQRGLKRIFTLSTRAFNYFVQKGGYREAGPDILPPGRRDQYEAMGRNSRILIKETGR